MNRQPTEISFYVPRNSNPSNPGGHAMSGGLRRALRRGG
jgi:hypothetical protein